MSIKHLFIPMMAATMLPISTNGFSKGNYDVCWRPMIAIVNAQDYHTLLTDYNRQHE